MRKILGVGLSIIDHLILVPEFPTGEGHTHCLDYAVQGGGMVGTAVCTAARLGASCEIWCRVGDDLPGREVFADLAERDIDISQCRVEPGGRTGICTVLVKAPTGERTFLYRPATHGAGATPLPNPARVDDAGVILVDGHWREAALVAMRRARSRGIPVVADLSRHVPDPHELLSLCDLPVLPVTAATHFAGTDDPADAARILGERAGRAAVVTLGAAGGVYWLAGRVHRYPSMPVEVVDTTGAGDCFHGAFCCAVAEGEDIHRAVRFAAAAAALSCRALGGRAALPTRNEVDALLSHAAP